MDIRIADIEEVTIVSILGRLDTASFAALEGRLTELLSHQRNKLVIDCAAMDYVSSSGLRVFLRVLKEVKASNGKLVVAGLQPVVRSIFEISGFLSIFTIADSAEAAIRQAQQ